MNTLEHGYDPSLVSRHLGRPVTCITRESDYLFPDGEDIAAAIIAAKSNAQVAEAVPESVPAHHFMRALRAIGVRNEVATYVNQLPEDDPIKDMWARAPYFYRASHEIESIRVGMGYTRKRIDNVFILAGKMQQ